MSNSTSTMNTLTDLYPHLIHASARAAELWAKVPGSHVVSLYIRNSYQNDPARVVLELLLFFFAIKYLLSNRYSPRKDTIKLSEREIDELVDDWVPEPLVPGETDPVADRRNLDEVASIPVLTSGGGAKVKVEGSNRVVLNLASFDVFGLANSERIKDKAIVALRKYGVGACNPPGFYGTMDVHMQLERDIARFIGADHAILYAQGFSAISSVVPAFSKRGDLVVVDEGVAFALQKGFQISRSKIVFFKHNDMNDLEHKLATIAAEDKRLKRPLYRKFILVEGIYTNSGDIAPLPKLVELKERFKYRLIVEESCSFGVLGANGRGITEHFGIPATKVDMLVGSLATSVGASGGFCAGSLPIIDHQRLSASSYCFSAALPPMLAVAASEGLAYIEKEAPRIMPAMQANIRVIRDILAQVPCFELLSSPESPLQHVRVARETLPFTFDPVDGLLDSESSFNTTNSTMSPRTGVLSLLGGSRANSRNANNNRPVALTGGPRRAEDVESIRLEQESRFLQDIVKESLENGVLVTRAKYNAEQEHACPRPSLKIVVPSDLTRKEAEQAAKVVKAAATKVIQAWAKARK
ncbi:pyridoxal phosphate-dependent transferase [Catenaria anguillulae PL171]|uniref:serine C-palmitoyltransferase n=1 Tax=Catenaria anguillulae PL171 TaxID=765915 RepID=A0A1Y2HHS4_9FUNG|nr:pyridoxal phosphate-dependent transferase [Catenaria anguillulae PL171]